jgi:enoyl-CoA hydratase/carnithine racemase
VRFPRTKPVIAAVNGHALAGGLELVLACDLAVAASTARLGLPEVTVGLIAGGGGVVRLPTMVPLKAAMKMLLTGQPVDAVEARRLGLVNAVVEPDQVHQAARVLAERIRAAAPLAVAATLRVAHAVASGVGDDGAWHLNDEALATLLDTADAAEGQQAFVAKRAPVWTGR